MVTSSSKEARAERTKRWAGRASVFSGRPDPEWDVSDELASRLIDLWEHMPAETVDRPVPTGLGYRYCVLSSGDGRRWLAFGGVVRYESATGFDLRRDAQGEFERELLESAPPGLLPPAGRSRHTT